jgi:hypothetical protein
MYFSNLYSPSFPLILKRWNITIKDLHTKVEGLEILKKSFLLQYNILKIC